MDVSSDTTGNQRARVANAMASCFTEDRLHTYDSEDMLREYPVLLEVLPLVVNPVIPGGGMYKNRNFPQRSLAWGFHIEAINLWFQPLVDRYDFVWVLEDDVGFTGRISELVVAYATDASDLLAGPAVQESDAPGTWQFGQPRPRLPPDFASDEDVTLDAGGWCWYHTRSVGFRDRLANLRGRPLSASEHVQRFSRRLLCELNTWSKEGAAAWSEMAAPTVCAALPDMRCRPLDRGSVGEVFRFDGKITQSEWTAFLEDPHQRDKLFHALKF